MQKIFITEPCHVPWNNMAPNETGRFCEVCALTVTDFTQMSNAQIVDHLAKSNGTVCGRYTTDQAQTSKRKWPRWMATVLAFVFGISLLSSCHRHLQGRYAAFPSKKDMREHKRTEIKAK